MLKSTIIATIILVSGFAQAEVLACKPQELVQKETKSGYATRLTNIKKSETVYMVNGKVVAKNEAIKAASKNQASK